MGSQFDSIKENFKELWFQMEKYAVDLTIGTYGPVRFCHMHPLPNGRPGILLKPSMSKNSVGESFHKNGVCSDHQSTICGLILCMDHPATVDPLKSVIAISHMWINLHSDDKPTAFHTQRRNPHFPSHSFP